jgi:AcrR family transcriptional regulator
MATTTPNKTRSRVPAAERRDALIEAAVHEFAHGGLDGTPVDRIARRVGVAQPYVFSLFGSKKALFLAAVERGFELVAATFTRAAAAYTPDSVLPGGDVLHAMGASYVDLLQSRRDYLMLQHQAYAAASDDPDIRQHVRALYAGLVGHVERLANDAAERHGQPPAAAERIDEFFRYGMWMNVAAALGVEDLSAGCEWVRAETNK